LQIFENAIGTYLFVMGKKGRYEFLRGAHSALWRAAVLFQREAKLRYGGAQIVAGLVHAKNLRTWGGPPRIRA
jgi:hypothetical protein